MNFESFQPITNIRQWSWQPLGSSEERNGERIQRVVLGFDTNGDPQKKLDQFVAVDVVLSESPQASIPEIILNSSFDVETDGVFDWRDTSDIVKNVEILNTPPPGYLTNMGWVEDTSTTDDNTSHLIEGGVYRPTRVPDDGRISMQNQGIKEVDLSALSERELEKIVLFDFAGNELSHIPPEILHMDNLEHLDLSNNPDMIGGVEIFQGLKRLEILNIGHTSVVGDLKRLKDITFLQQLAINDTQVSGNIEDVPDFLKGLFMGGATNVVGNIKDLPFSLKSLAIEGVKGIVGDIETLPPNMQVLGLGGSNVEGDIGDLRSDDSLEIFYIDHLPDVYGDIEKVAEMTNLMHLDLSNSGVRGNVSALDNLDNLRNANLSHTAISGTLRPHHIADMDKLETLSVNDSRIQIENRIQIEDILNKRSVNYNFE